MGCGVSGGKKIWAETPSTELNISRSHFVRGTAGNVLLKYDLIKEIGTGAYATVHEALHKETGVRRAIKILPKFVMSEEAKSRFINEFEILRRTDHPNIVTLYEYYEDDRNFYLVQELCSGGELLDMMMSREQGFSEVRAACYIKQVLSAVCHCHSMNIVHRDLKPDNLLLEHKHPSSAIKVIDFGISCLTEKSKTLTQKTGTIQYMAPEIFRVKYNEKCDVWSCGVILFTMLSGKMPFGGNSDKEIVQSISKGKYSMTGPEWASISEGAKELVRKMLQIDPNRRPSAEQCFNDDWIQKTGERLNPEVLSNAIENMRSFRANTKLKRAVLSFIVSQLISQQERQELNRVFTFLDTTGDGRLNTQELSVGLHRATGLSISENEVDGILKQIDTDNNGFIDYSEFIMSAMPRTQLLSPERLRSAFDTFDTDRNGVISRAELKETLELKGDIILQDILDEVDENGDGEIDFQEFHEMMLGE